MKVLCIQYPNCVTCKRAVQWLKDNNIEYTDRDIRAENPTREELEHWHKISPLPLKRFFNTSGMLYKQLHLKDKLADMSEDEQLDLLASDGMMVRRPILVGDDFVLFGFRPAQWEEALKK